MMRALIESPVFRNCKIEYLIRDVMGSKYGRALAGMDKSRAIGALTAPIATAIAIGTFAPELREKQSIKLVVPGAEMVDHFDYGQWYQMIGWLLGVEELHIEVTHVGPRIGTSNGRDIQSHYRELPKDLGFVHSNSSRKYLGEYLESTNQKFDFAMIFQPGFSAHSQWFKDGGLRKLIDDGTKICVSAYAESELPDELFISKFFGFGTTLSSVVENPYSFGSLKQAGEPKFLAENKWGSLLWQLERRPAPAVEFSDRYVYAVDVVQSQAEAVGLNGMDAMIAYNNSLRSFGVLVAKGMVPALPDMNDSEEMVSLPQECMVLTSCGKVFDLWLERFVDGVVIPPNVIQSYRIQSENGTFTFARLLWSIWVFRDFVEAPLKRQRLC